MRLKINDFAQNRPAVDNGTQIVCLRRGAHRRPVCLVVHQRIIGGDLVTLLYMTQIAAVSQDPWFSRIGSLEYADFAAIDLDEPTFSGRGHTRLKQIEHLMRTEQVDLELYWTAP